LAQALAAVRKGDTLVVPKLDRLARSVPDARAIAVDVVISDLARSDKDMTQQEIAENRKRIRHGLPPLFAADEAGRQTPQSRAAAREHRALAEARTLERIKRRFS
jgi:hypothetical protein